ncbi:MAG: YicC/YloC family endoribonuclease [Fimbriiglobus sp.]
MIFSMTGFGAARADGSGFSVELEIRSVNNRHLKVTVRGTEPYPLMESEFEKILRKTIKRGTLSIHIRVQREPTATDAPLNTELLAAYLKQLESVTNQLRQPELLPGLVSGVLALPGVAPEGIATSSSRAESEWPVIEQVLEAALVKLQKARQTEGEAMSHELVSLHGCIASELDAVNTHLPSVMTAYRERLLQRVRVAVAEAGVTIEPEQLIREIALFADRTDVAEEIHRLGAHLVQLADLAKQGGDGAGRRLEFLAQEMGREVNTLGSKAGDVTISRHVFEMKSALEKIRELVQNIE